MKKILYLHGFASSGASGTVELLRKWFWERAEPAHRAVVVAPDIPLDPLVAEKTLEALAYDEMPALVIGTSMGGMYAQMLHGFTRICVNPAFWISRKYDILYVGKHKWLNKRKDGETEFHVTKETVAHFQELESRQFDGIDDDDRTMNLKKIEEERRASRNRMDCDRNEGRFAVQWRPGEFRPVRRGRSGCRVRASCCCPRRRRTA